MIRAHIVSCTVWNIVSVFLSCRFLRIKRFSAARTTRGTLIRSQSCSPKAPLVRAIIPMPARTAVAMPMRISKRNVVRIGKAVWMTPGVGRVTPGAGWVIPEAGGVRPGRASSFFQNWRRVTRSKIVVPTNSAKPVRWSARKTRNKV